MHLVASVRLSIHLSVRRFVSELKYYPQVGGLELRQKSLNFLFPMVHLT